TRGCCFSSKIDDRCGSQCGWITEETGAAMWKYVLAWIPMVLIAIVNGAIREGWYSKYLSEMQAHQVSTATGVLLFGIYIWALMRICRPASAGHVLTIGLVWLGMTVAFEVLFGTL